MRAKAVLWLASVDSDYIPGATVFHWRKYERFIQPSGKAAPTYRSSSSLHALCVGQFNLVAMPKPASNTHFTDRVVF